MFRAFIVLAAAISVASATKSVSLSVSAPESVADVSRFEVVTTIANTGDETLKLLNDPRSALTSWATNTFDVSNADGVAPEFTGVIVRYIPEVAAKSEDENAFTVLAPGASVDVTHEVGNYYNFTRAGTGAFTFTPNNLFQHVNDDGTLTVIEANTSPALTKLTGQLSSSSFLSPSSLGGSNPDMRRNSALGKRASYRSNCSSSRQTTNNQALTASATLARNSVSHLQSNPSGSSLQTTWYGTFASSRYSVTLKSFQTLQTAPSGWTYDCSCTETQTYAYVYPSSYGVVYLCGLYWNVPTTGSGSRADTIIHEGTHFPQVLGTDDYTYGESSCKSLARSNPTNAVYNADNHAFFSDYA
ncbi:extracellular protease [Moniliophthora roreri]|nr:extracellular protease [Moniliophthora roreri]